MHGGGLASGELVAADPDPGDRVGSVGELRARRAVGACSEPRRDFGDVVFGVEHRRDGPGPAAGAGLADQRDGLDVVEHLDAAPPQEPSE